MEEFLNLQNFYTKRWGTLKKLTLLFSFFSLLYTYIYIRVSERSPKWADKFFVDFRVATALYINIYCATQRKRRQKRLKKQGDQIHLDQPDDHLIEQYQIDQKINRREFPFDVLFKNPNKKYKLSFCILNISTHGNESLFFINESINLSIQNSGFFGKKREENTIWLFLEISVKETNCLDDEIIYICNLYLYVPHLYYIHFEKISLLSAPSRTLYCKNSKFESYVYAIQIVIIGVFNEVF